METKTKIAAVAVAVAIGAAGGIGALVADDSVRVDELVSEKMLLLAENGNLTVDLDNALNVEPVIIDNTVECVPANITKEVYVDNENLQLVLDTIYDADGNVEYLIDDLDDDETDLIVDRIVFENETTIGAESFVEANIVDYLDDEDLIIGEDDLVNYRDNDVYSVIVDEDESVFEVSDYDDSEATVYVETKLKLNNDDDKASVEVIAEVEFENDKFEIVDVVIKE